jgi:hypothetical protein
MKTQAEVRQAFWDRIKENSPGMYERDYRKSYRQNDYSATIRCEWVDYVDQLARDGKITEALAQRVTL